MTHEILREQAELAVLWGKSDAGGQPNLLVQHLLDAAAVGELIWARFLAPTVKNAWDTATGGHGRNVFILLCGLHDVGKATPAFQSKVPALAEAVDSAGLSWPRLGRDEQAWHHRLAGARIVREVLLEEGWSRETVSWLWPFIAGHHGQVPSAAKLTPPGRGGCHGLADRWSRVQRAIVRLITDELDIDVHALSQVRPASRATQLALLGSLVMADWIASSDKHFPGVPALDDVSLASARTRAEAGWAALGLRGGWNPQNLPNLADPIAVRFNRKARPGQLAVVDLAETVPAPCLLIVEAPMGEGKTEAALAAAEVLARRFGADGVFIGMPTQATSDPMFGRVRRWAEHVDRDVPLALLHGKARFDRDWSELRSREIRLCGVDEYGCNDEYGMTTGSSPVSTEDEPPGQAPAQWFLGNKRGLLTPIVVGTVDQLLYAATRTRHVMLRHAGLTGKVVVLDEVHAYDVYTTQFLHEALRWLAEAGVPVMVLSATLPPATRAELAQSYLQGTLGVRDVDLKELPSPEGYPSAMTVTAVDGAPVFDTRSADPWRPSARVEVNVLEEPADGSPLAVVEVLRDRLRDGGCALVIRNTVGRAQQTYLAVREVFGQDAVLLHARLTAGERADRTQRVLAMLGPAPTPGAAEMPDASLHGLNRPKRLVVVATQLAEQSFDVDADLLITDLPPIDLLLQRVGRLHRHDRPPLERPEPVREPHVVVTGMRIGQDGVPRFPRGSKYVYGELMLLRAAHLVSQAVGDGSGWSVPAEVPALVERGYGDDTGLPPSLAEAVRRAAVTWQQEQAARRTRAEQFLLSGPDGSAPQPSPACTNGRSPTPTTRIRWPQSCGTATHRSRWSWSAGASAAT